MLRRVERTPDAREIWFASAYLFPIWASLSAKGCLAFRKDLRSFATPVSSVLLGYLCTLLSSSALFPKHHFAEAFEPLVG